ncbi:hypothetical protein VTO73DRAFT_12131 [Trametes versicolor]
MPVPLLARDAGVVSGQDHEEPSFYSTSPASSLHRSDIASYLIPTATSRQTNTTKSVGTHIQQVAAAIGAGPQFFDVEHLPSRTRESKDVEFSEIEPYIISATSPRSMKQRSLLCISVVRPSPGDSKALAIYEHRQNYPIGRWMNLSLVCDVSGLTIVRGIVAFQRYIEWQRQCQTLYSTTGTQSPTQHRGFVLLIPEGACLRKAIVGWETGRGSAWRFENLECAAYFPSVRHFQMRQMRVCGSATSALVTRVVEGTDSCSAGRGADIPRTLKGVCNAGYDRTTGSRSAELSEDMNVAYGW